MAGQDEMAKNDWSNGMDKRPDSNEIALPEPEKQKVTNNDLLQTYFKDIRSYPLLSREEEIKTFKRYKEFGDEEAKKLLVVSNLRLVIKIAIGFHKYNQFRFPLVDFIQEGNMGLIRAVDKYDLGKEVKFSYYASFWIKAYIMNYIKNNWSMVRFVTNVNKRKLFNRLEKEKMRLATLGIDPDSEIIAENLDVKVRDVLDMEAALSGNDISLDQPLLENGNTPRLDLTPSSIDTEKMVSDNDMEEKGRAILEAFRKKLSPRELTIFNKRIYCEEASTLEVLGEELALSRERVRQIEKQIYEELEIFSELKTKEVAMATREIEELTDVTLSEVQATTRPNTKSREVAILYFGLKDERSGLEARDIVERTGIPKSSVASYISQVRKKIKRNRDRKNKEPHPGRDNRTTPAPNEGNPVSGLSGLGSQIGKGEKSRENDNSLKNNSAAPLHLVVERGSKKFEMNITGGPIYDVLVKYLGL